MPREAHRSKSSSSTLASDEILAALPPERRQEILEEAIGARLRTIIADHQEQTFGALFEALKSDLLWSHFQQVKVGAILRAPAKAAVPARPSVEEQHAPDAAPAPAVAPAPAPAAAEAATKPQKVGIDLDALLDLVKKHPGLRAEELRRVIGGKPEALSLALAALRNQGKLKTAGAARGTTYTAVG
jgi:hypothetical protein